MTLPGYYLHPAGHPSRFGVLDVGLKCVHSCGFCFYLYMDGSDDPTQGMRRAKFHSKEHVIGLVDGLADNGFLGFDITGGEPALHPNIIDIVERAKERGIASRIITLGQFLQKPMHGRSEKLIDALLAAGLTDFRLSVHEVEEPQFKALTGGSWAKQLANMEELDARGFQYMTNTTINQKNYKRLPLIAKELVKHNVYNATLLFMMAHYQWSKNGHAQEIQSRYTEAAKYAREFINIIEDARIACITRYAPLCTIAGLERNHVGAVGVRYDPHEWMNAMDHKLVPEDANQASPSQLTERIRNFQPGQASDGLNLIQGDGILAGHKLVAGRGPPHAVGKVFPEQCKGCSAMPVCDGVEPQYIERFGGSEFVPYIGVNRGEVIDVERLNYRPAYFVKLAAYADIKQPIARAFQPEPIAERPQVSVIVTCHNYGQYLGACLESVKAQTYDIIELIIVDDASTDNSREIAHDFIHSTARFPGNGAVLYSLGKNFGQPAGPRNYGVEKSNGSLIVCLDADDLLTPTYIEECVQEFRKHPEASIVYTGVTTFGDAEHQWSTPAFDYGRELMQNFITCASMYRRRVWDDVGGYKTNVRGMEDYNFWVEACGLGHIGVPIPRQLWKYRIHTDGVFQSDVVPNFEAKYRQLVLNNYQLYPPGMVTAARAGRDVPRQVD